MSPFRLSPIRFQRIASHEAQAWLDGPDAPELGISQSVLDLVTASQEALARAEAEQEAQRRHELEQARELAEEQRLRAEEREQAAKSLHTRLLLAMAAVGIAFFASIAAVWFGVDANRQRDSAERALATATVAQGQAEVQRVRADGEAAEAERAARRALAGQVAAVGRNLLVAGEADKATWAALAAMKNLTYTASLESLLWDSLDQWRLIRRIQYREIPQPEPPILSQQTALEHSVRGLYFSRDDRYLAAAYADGTAVVWDWDSSQPLLVDRYETPVTGALLSLNDAYYFITSGLNGELRIWDRAGKRLLHTLSHPGPVRSIALHPNGKWVGARVGNRIYLWNIRSGAQVASSPYTAPVDLRSIGFTQDGKNGSDPI